MSSFTLTPQAEGDFDDIAAYLRGLPHEPAARIARELEQTLVMLGQRPKLGHLHEEFSKLRGEPVRTFGSGQYVCYYVDQPVPVLLGLLHGRRDVASIMRRRLQ